jgi:hypothetical protein
VAAGAGREGSTAPRREWVTPQSLALEPKAGPVGYDVLLHMLPFVANFSCAFSNGSRGASARGEGWQRVWRGMRWMQQRGRDASAARALLRGRRGCGSRGRRRRGGPEAWKPLRWRSRHCLARAPWCRRWCEPGPVGGGQRNESGMRGDVGGAGAAGAAGSGAHDLGCPRISRAYASEGLVTHGGYCAGRCWGGGWGGTAGARAALLELQVGPVVRFCSPGLLSRPKPKPYTLKPKAKGETPRVPLI